MKIVHIFLLTTYIYIFESVTFITVQVSVADTCHTTLSNDSNDTVKRKGLEWYERQEKVIGFKTFPALFIDNMMQYDANVVRARQTY